MLRSSRWSRALSALFAVWFALVLGDPGVLHTCPMHGAHGAGAAPSTSLGMTSGAAHHSHGEPGQSKDSQPAPCTCVGQCCAASSVVAPAPTVTFVEAVVRHPARQLPEMPSDDAPASSDLRLPFANGPPRI